MEDQTKKMILLGTAAFIVVALIFAAIFYFTGSDKSPAAEKAQVQPVQEIERVPSPGATPAVNRLEKLPQDSKEAQLKRFSLDFVARFGTYSTDGDSMNLVQLMPLLTGDLRVWAQGRIAQKTIAEKFTAVSTKALSAKILTQTSKDATVQVSTQRVYTEGNSERVVYEDATMALLYSQGWQVSSVTWKQRPE